MSAGPSPGPPDQAINFLVDARNSWHLIRMQLLSDRASYDDVTLVDFTGFDLCLKLCQQLETIHEMILSSQQESG